MNFFTEKLAGREGIDLVKRGLLPLLLWVEQKGTLCVFANACKDYLTLQESRINDDTPDKDLMDQYHELCTHPAEEAREISCGHYRNFKKIGKAYVQGAEEILTNWGSKGELN